MSALRCSFVDLIDMFFSHFPVLFAQARCQGPGASVAHSDRKRMVSGLVRLCVVV